jgi:ABC-type bacteriocin/lantibiotic exporter with double-glycine peptidase domain
MPRAITLRSTLTKLIQRLYIPESRRVLIDGIDLSVIDPAWLRRLLQESVLFNCSVRDKVINQVGENTAIVTYDVLVLAGIGWSPMQTARVLERL